jgi:hypothetical protein
LPAPEAQNQSINAASSPTASQVWGFGLWRREREFCSLCKSDWSPGPVAQNHAAGVAQNCGSFAQPAGIVAIVTLCFVKVVRSAVLAERVSTPILMGVYGSFIGNLSKSSVALAENRERDAKTPVLC